MLNLIIVLLAFLITYSYFRSFGGKGIGVNPKFAPENTPAGKHQRMIGWFLMTLMISTVIFVNLRQAGNVGLIAFSPFAAGALGMAVYILSKRGKK